MYSDSKFFGLVQVHEPLVQCSTYMYLLPDFTSLSQCLADSPAEQLWPGILHTYLVSESS